MKKNCSKLSQDAGKEQFFVSKTKEIKIFLERDPI